jgi:chorismate mutase/prephenate dehydratase
VDLTKLESRPIPGRPWEYRFFADIRNVAPGMLEACLQELAELTLELRIMGTYPESEA